MIGIPHRPHEEPGIKKMENRMFDPADILIHGQPVFTLLSGDRRVRMGRAEAREIPGRIHEGVEGVGVPFGGFAAGRAVDMLPGRVPVERIAG